MEELNIQYWSHGPHYQHHDSVVFITWRLAGTLPATTLALFKQLKFTKMEPETIHELDRIKDENSRLFKLFCDYDRELVNWQAQGFTLNDNALASIITGSLQFYANKRYELHSYCVMSNHVHLLIRALTNSNGEYHRIGDIVRDIKRYTAHELNKAIGSVGQIWDDYYFDRIIRNDKNYTAVVEYIMSNPVAAA